MDKVRKLDGSTVAKLFGAMREEHLVLIVQALEQALGCGNADESLVYQFEIGSERYEIKVTAEMALLRALDVVLEMRGRGLLKPTGDLLPGGAADLAWRKTFERADEEYTRTGECFLPLQRTVRLIVDMLARGLLELDMELLRAIDETTPAQAHLADARPRDWDPPPGRECREDGERPLDSC